MNSPKDSEDDLPLNQVAEEFVARYRRGECPSVSDFISRHPNLAEEIRELIPALVMMEDARPTPEMPAAGVTDAKGNRLERLGEFRILREIGRGGMGIVYEAEQESLGRKVALKILPRHAMLDSRQLERFQRESRSAAKLHHTNIVPVYGIGEHEGLHYHVMQLIEGRGLDQILDEVSETRKSNSRHRSRLSLNRPKPPNATGQHQFEETDALVAAASPAAGETIPSDAGSSYWNTVARIGVQVADALSYANSQGVLHRDIKPSNLMLDANGMVWVTDFGLAKASDSVDLTQSGDVVGTISYMAPERLNGDSDQRSDIYSLGITLYEMLTLQHPFAKSDRQQLLRQISFEELPSPRSIDPSIPRDLETIVLKAIAKRPSDRYQSADLFAADLRRFLDDHPIHARRLSIFERGWRLFRRNPGVVTLTAMTILLAAAVSVGIPLLHVLRRDRDQAIFSQKRAVVAEQQALSNQQRAERAEREVKIRSHLAQATAIRRSGKMGQRFDCLNEIAQAAKLTPSEPIRQEMRAEAIAAMALTDLRVSAERKHEGMYGPQFDAELRRYAFVDYLKSGDAIVRQQTDARELFRAPKPSFSFWYVVTEFSDDGRYLLVTYFLRDERPGDAVLHCWDLQDHKLILNCPIRSADVISSVTTRKSLLYYVNRQSELCVWNLEKRLEQKRLPLGMTPYNICVNPDGNRVAVNDYHTPLARILNLDTGEEISSWTADVGRFAMAWSEDEQLLATSTEDGRIFVRDVAAGKTRFQLDTDGTTIRLAFAHRSHLLASSNWEFSTRLWDAANGKELVTASGVFLRFSKDDKQIAFGSAKSTGVWELAHNQEIRYFQPASTLRQERADQLLTGSVFSPDDRLLITFGHGGMWFWDRATGVELGHVDSGNTTSVLFRADSSSVVVHSVGLGIYEWPVRTIAEEDYDVLRVGPPKLLHALPVSVGFPGSLAWLPDQRSVAFADNQQSSVLVISADPEKTSPNVLFSLSSEHARMTNVAVSPDGRWVAAGGWKEESIQVWSLEDRRLETRLPHSDHTADTRFWVHFSPDNRWLLSAAASGAWSGYLARRVGTWERGFYQPAEAIGAPNVVFAGASEFMAFNISKDFVSIADSSDGSELMRLSTSQRGDVYAAALSNRGEELVLTTSFAPSTWWNLRRVNQQLRTIGLSWNKAQELSDTSLSSDAQGDLWVSSSNARRAMRLQTDAGEFPSHRRSAIQAAALANEMRAWRAQAEAGDWATAWKTIERAMSQSPDNVMVMNEVAWTAVKKPSSDPEQSKRGLELAKRLIEMVPDNGDYLNTLGVALYRNGNWKDAITALKRAEELSPNRITAHNAYFIAMSFWQLSDPAAAIEWYEKAIAWKIANPSVAAQYESELQPFHEEAASLLKMP